MPLDNILGSKPTDFRTKRKRILANDSTIKIEDFGEEIDFQKMSSFRIPVDSQTMSKQLNSEQGFVAANVGVSASIELEFKNKKYILACAYGKKDGRIQVELISGYHQHGRKFIESTLEEISEELLVVDKDEKIQKGFFSAFGIDSSLPYKSFVEKYPCSDSFSYEITRGGSLEYLPSLDKRKIHGMDPDIKATFNSNLSSVQIFFPIKMSMPLSGSLYHTEDVLSQKKMRLDIKMNRKGILLLEKADEGLSGKIFYLSKGNLIQGPNPEMILLRFFFVSKNSFGVIDKTHIPFEEYLTKN